MKIRTRDLSGKPLGWAVAKCQTLLGEASGFEIKDGVPFVLDGYWQEAYYWFDWALVGPILDAHEISVERVVGGWIAFSDYLVGEFPAESPQEAILRCHLAVHLGDEIDVPDELVGE